MFDKCQMLIVFNLDLEFPPYFTVIHRSIELKLTKGSPSARKNDQLFSLMFCSLFHFLYSSSEDSK